jgi:dTDP-4-dehydrorhamnose 3,5-epimerase
VEGYDMKLLHELKKNLSKQNYGTKNHIHDVQIIELKRHSDDGGAFTELARLSEDEIKNIPGFKIRQVNFSEMDPGSIKAFHIHLNQTDIWFVPPDDKLLLILKDLRADSESSGISMRLILGDKNSQLVVIPPGIAHGCKNLGTNTANIIYFIDKQFVSEPESCDEYRLPWDQFGKELWDVTKA